MGTTDDAEKRVRSEFSKAFVALDAPFTLYQEEMLTLVNSTIESTRSWTIRRQCFRALVPLVPQLTEPLDVLLEQTEALVLREARSVKKWKGKGASLKALAALACRATAPVEFVAQGVLALCELLSSQARSASKALVQIVALKPQPWPLLWPVPLRVLVTAEGPQLEACFFVISHCFRDPADAPDDTSNDVLAIIREHGITKQSVGEVRVAALAALAQVLSCKRHWDTERVLLVRDVINLTLQDRFSSVREAAASRVVTAAAQSAPFCAAVAAMPASERTAWLELLRRHGNAPALVARFSGL